MSALIFFFFNLPYLGFLKPLSPFQSPNPKERKKVSRDKDVDLIRHSSLGQFHSLSSGQPADQQTHKSAAATVANRAADPISKPAAAANAQQKESARQQSSISKSSNKDQ